MLLWFFDSRGGRVFQPGQGDSPVDNWVDTKVVSWFRSTRDEYNRQNGCVIPSLAFVHIPVHGAAAFQRSGKRTAHTEPGLDAELIGHQGECSESLDCWNGGDIPLMKALAETQGLKAVFSGHDHGVDWCMKWTEDIPKESSNGDGYDGYSDWARGARKIVVGEKDDDLQTWIRLEDGSISGHITLNATYDMDQYPEIKPKPVAIAKPSSSSRIKTVVQSKTKSTPMKETPSLQASESRAMTDKTKYRTPKTTRVIK